MDNNQLLIEKTKSAESTNSTSSILDWDHDLAPIPRLQVVDEHQNFW